MGFKIGMKGCIVLPTYNERENIGKLLENLLEIFKNIKDFDFEFDLMVMDAVENFDLYLKLGPKRLIFHPDLGGEIEEFEHFLEGLDMYISQAKSILAYFKSSTQSGDKKYQL